MILKIGSLLIAAACSLSGQQGKPDFSGVWTLDPDKSELTITKSKDLTWSIKQSGNTLQQAETWKDAGQAAKAEMQCETVGKECGLNGPQPAKVMVYYNGPSLVQIHRIGEGDAVVKRLLKLSDDKATLEVQVQQIVPEAKTEKLVFRKAPAKAEETQSAAR